VYSLVFKVEEYESKVNLLSRNKKTAVVINDRGHRRVWGGVAIHKWCCVLSF